MEHIQVISIQYLASAVSMTIVQFPQPVTHLVCCAHGAAAAAAT